MLSLTKKAKNSSSILSNMVKAAIPYKKSESCASHLTLRNDTATGTESHKNRPNTLCHILQSSSTQDFISCEDNISTSSSPPPTANKLSLIHQLLPTNVTQVCVISWSILSYLKTTLPINLPLEFKNATTHDALLALFSKKAKELHFFHH